MLLCATYISAYTHAYKLLWFITFIYTSITLFQENKNGTKVQVGDRASSCMEQNKLLLNAKVNVPSELGPAQLGFSVLFDLPFQALMILLNCI